MQNLIKANATKIASIAHNGYAQAIFPVHTMSDGDTIFVLSTNEVEAMSDAVGVLATHAMGKAINKAVLSSQECYGLPSTNSIKGAIKDEK